MRALSLVLTLLCSAVWADDSLLPFQHPRGGGPSVSATSISAVGYTTAAVQLYVDPTGSDANNCTATGTAACLTIQGALNKVPRVLRHGVTITIAAGSYAGFYVSGFTIDPSVQQASAGILIDGTLANSTLATGSATGTATAGAAASGSTFGTITDSAATWTTNDLRGRLLVTTGGTGSGQTKVISSNTGTVITVVGAWGTTPAAATTYAIQDSATLIATGIPSMATPLNASTANLRGIVVVNNDAAYTANALTFRNLRMTVAIATTVLLNDASNVTFTQCQFAGTTGTSTRINSLAGVPGNLVITSVAFLSTATTGNHVSAAGGVSATGCLFQEMIGAIALNTPTSGMGSAPFLIVTGCEALDSHLGSGGNGPAVFEVKQGTGAINTSRVDCATGVSGAAIGGATEVGIYTNMFGANSLPVRWNVTSTNVSDCSVGLFMSNGGFALLTGTAALSGSVTYGMDIRFGATVQYVSTSPTITASTSEILIDQTATYTFANINTGSCASSLTYGSRACSR